MNEPIPFFEHLEEIKGIIDNKEILLFLDYDGTLTPIVDKPELAVISEEMREAVQSTAQHIKTSIVSGRATDDVRSKVRLEGLFYAGSHGFEIVDPSHQVTVNEEARAIRGAIDEAHKQLSKQLSKVKGALVEHVKYTISTHYRLVSEADFPKVEKAVNDILQDYPSLRRTDGKKVFELRPKIDWDKGRAVKWILNVLRFDPDQHIPVYIGDDTTDEDAFRVLKTNGFGVLVAEEKKLSQARYMIKNTGEVKQVLDYFVGLSK